MSLSLGCDVCQGGVKNVGPCLLQSFINTTNASMVDINKSLIEYIAKKLNTAVEIMQICVDSIMHDPEKGTHVNDNSIIETHAHLHQDPSNLNACSKEHAHENNEQCQITNEENMVLT